MNFKIGGGNVEFYSFIFISKNNFFLVSQLCSDCWGKRDKLCQHLHLLYKNVMHCIFRSVLVWVKLIPKQSTADFVLGGKNKRPLLGNVVFEHIWNTKTE